MTKILFVDSNKSFLDTMVKYLSWYDFHVTTWEDSTSVINHCQSNDYDVCIFDVFSTPINGYHLADLVKKHPDSRIHQMKILVVFEEEPPLENFIFIRKNGIYAMMKYSSIERWVEKILAISRSPI